MIENILNRGKHTVRRMILPPGRDGKNRILLVFAAFGLGILASFFFSERILIITEAILLVAAVIICLGDR